MFILELLLIAVVSYVFVFLAIKFAHKLDLYDVPNARSHHCHVTPTGAGIAFISVFFLSVLLFEFQLFMENWYLFLAIFMIFLIGIVDDHSDVSPRLKFIVIFVAVFVMWLFDVSIDHLGVWFGFEITLYPILALFITMFSLAGFTNALNLIDGLDGLSTSVSIVILAFFVFIGIEYNDNLMIVIGSFSMASLVGFLVLNWNPAKIFMGDSGSLTLGFIISVLSVLSIQYIHPVTILYLAAIPILDTLIVMVRRIRKGESPFSADKTHIHHILVHFFNKDVKQTVFFMVIMQILFSGTGYVISENINTVKAYGLPVFALFGFLLISSMFYMIFTGMHKRQILLDKQQRD